MSFQPFVPFDGSTKGWDDRRKETSQSSPFLPSLFLRSFPPPSHQPSSPPTTYLSDQVHPDAVLRMQARQQTPGTAGRQAFAARTRAQEDGFVEGRESDAWTGDCVGTRRESWGHLHQPKADFFYLSLSLQIHRGSAGAQTSSLRRLSLSPSQLWNSTLLFRHPVFFPSTISNSTSHSRSISLRGYGSSSSLDTSR